MYLLIIAGALVVIVGALMVLVAAFRKSVLWGLGCLFVPFVSLIFTVLNWDVAKRGFLAQLAGIVLVFIGFAGSVGTGAVTQYIDLNTQIARLGTTNVQESYSHMAKGYQASMSLENFQQLLKAHPSLVGNQGASWSAIQTKDSPAKWGGKLKGKSGVATPFEVSLVKENGEWRITEMSAPGEPGTGPTVAEPPKKSELPGRIEASAQAESVGQTVAEPPKKSELPRKTETPSRADSAAQTAAAQTKKSGMPKETEVPAKADPAGLKLTGIFYKRSNPTAFVNDKLVHVGDKVSGYQVVTIEPDRVTLKTADGQTAVLESK